MVEENVIAELRRLVAYHKLLGIDHYPTTKEITDFLLFEQENRVEIQEEPPYTPPSVAPSVQRTATETVLPQKSVTIPSTIQHSSADDLCASCSLKSQQKAFIEGRGGENVRLLVVGGWLIHDPNPMVKNEKSVFGVEEDLMLARMFAAMKLSPNEVFVTNLVKCCLEKGVRPTAPDLGACHRLLQKQIADLQPEMICAMGSLAAKTLLKKERSLSQLRGKVFQTEVAEGLTIPVLATYHPSYLVHNEEMKKPTWEDLQKVAGRLNGRRKR